MRKLWKVMYEDAIRARRNDLVRLHALEKALKFGWTIVAGESYDGACDCTTCLPKREFLKTAETLTASDAACEHRWTTAGFHSNEYCEKCFADRPTQRREANMAMDGIQSGDDMSGEQPADPYIHWRLRAETAEAEVARLNMEMEAYRQKLTPKDVEAMTAVIKSLQAAKDSASITPQVKTSGTAPSVETARDQPRPDTSTAITGTKS